MSAAAPIQKWLPIRCEMQLPTCDLVGARAILGKHENEIKELADADEFPCWNIARPGSGRAERRFLTRALRDYAEGRPVNRDEDWIIRLLYGREKPFILGKYFYAAWNCDEGTASNLIEDGVLKVVPGSTYGRGRGNTPCITWASAVQFLKDRRWKA